MKKLKTIRPFIPSIRKDCLRIDPDAKFDPGNPFAAIVVVTFPMYQTLAYENMISDNREEHLEWALCCQEIRLMRGEHEQALVFPPEMAPRCFTWLQKASGSKFS